MKAAWFRRYLEIPGVWLPEGPSVDRTTLRGHKAVPEINDYEFDGKRRISLMWPMPGGSTSASPASEWKRSPRRGESEAETDIRWLFERLELPATPEEYLWFLNEGISGLLTHRRDHPWVLPLVERLCLAAADFLEAHPEILGEDASPEGSRYVSVFANLLNLYGSNGYLREARAVAERARRFGHHAHVLDEIEARARALAAEEER